MQSEINSDRARKNPVRSDMTDVVDSIRAIVKVLRDSGRDAEQTLGVTSAQLYVLQELRHGPASINELAARTFTHQSSVSMVVTRLVESRLVTRTAAKGDARRLSVSLTNTGRALIRRSPDVGQNRLVTALKAMPSPDLKSLANQLNNLMQIMDDQREESRSVRRSAGAPA